MPQRASKYEFYFDDPRLRMTIAGRILVRVVSYVSYLVLFVAMFMFLLSYDIRPIFYLGLFLVLVVVDNDGDAVVLPSKMDPDGGGASFKMAVVTLPASR